MEGVLGGESDEGELERETEGKEGDKGWGEGGEGGLTSVKSTSGQADLTFNQITIISINNHKKLLMIRRRGVPTSLSFPHTNGEEEINGNNNEGRPKGSENLFTHVKFARMSSFIKYGICSKRGKNDTINDGNSPCACEWIVRFTEIHLFC